MRDMYKNILCFSTKKTRGRKIAENSDGVQRAFTQDMHFFPIEKSVRISESPQKFRSNKEKVDKLGEKNTQISKNSKYASTNMVKIAKVVKVVKK